MKISIITVCQNSENTTILTLITVLSQTYKDIKYIIVDVEKKPISEFLESFKFIWKLRIGSFKRLIRFYESFFNFTKEKNFKKKFKKLNIYSVD
jgi:hypothetical protein